MEEIVLSYSDLKVLLAFGRFDRLDGVSIVLKSDAAFAAMDAVDENLLLVAGGGLATEHKTDAEGGKR